MQARSTHFVIVAPC